MDNSLFNLYKVGKITKETALESKSLTNIFTEYTNSGVYTKKTMINTDSSVELEMKKYFLGSVQLDRTTYFTDKALLMCDYNGNVGAETINSGYGTVTEDNLETIKSQFKNAEVGDMTHFKYVNGAPEYDYIVKKSSNHVNWAERDEQGNPVGEGMEGFYTTARDFAEADYFDSSWTLVGNVYSHEIDKRNEKSVKYLKDFLDVAAPCLQETALTNYLTVEKLVVKEENDKLHLQILLVDNEDADVKLDVDNCVLAEAIIQKGHMKTYYFTNNYSWKSVHSYLFGDAGNNAWPGAQMTFDFKNDQDQDVYRVDVDLSRYHTVIFNDNETANTQTADVKLAYDTNGYYVSGGSGKNHTVETWTK